MSEKTILTLVEGQVVDEIERGNLREVKSAQCSLAPRRVEWILSAGNRIAAGSSGKDLAGVIHRLAPGKVESTAESMPVPNPQFSLQSVVGGPRCILAIADVAEIAIRPP